MVPVNDRLWPNPVIGTRSTRMTPRGQVRTIGPAIMVKFLLDHVLEGEKPNYVVDWVLMPAVKDYAALWLTEEARQRWDGTVFEHPVSRGA